MGEGGWQLQITVITRNDLFHKNSHACRFVFECIGGLGGGGSRCRRELWGGGALRLVLNALRLIVFGAQLWRGQTNLRGGLFVFFPLLFFFFCTDVRAARKRGQPNSPPTTTTTTPALIMIMRDTIGGCQCAGL